MDNAGFDIPVIRPKMTVMNAAGPHTLLALGGLAAGAVLAALAPAHAFGGVGSWIERWVIAPFGQLVYLGFSCF